MIELLAISADVVTLVTFAYGFPYAVVKITRAIKNKFKHKKK